LTSAATSRPAASAAEAVLRTANPITAPNANNIKRFIRASSSFLDAGRTLVYPLSP
jgi:hypothetical protein